jgi:hypothetical protein
MFRGSSPGSKRGQNAANIDTAVRPPGVETALRPCTLEQSHGEAGAAGTLRGRAP